jgi:hypothetical protein
MDGERGDGEMEGREFQKGFASASNTQNLSIQQLTEGPPSVCLRKGNTSLVVRLPAVGEGGTISDLRESAIRDLESLLQAIRAGGNFVVSDGDRLFFTSDHFLSSSLSLSSSLPLSLPSSLSLVHSKLFFTLFFFRVFCLFLTPNTQAE